MTISTVQTTTHDYLRDELDAIIDFYGGKRCFVQKMLGSVEWSLILDTSIESCNGRVSQYLIISCTMLLKMRPLALRNAYTQIVSRSTSPTPSESWNPMYSFMRPSTIYIVLGSRLTLNFYSATAPTNFITKNFIDTQTRSLCAALARSREPYPNSDLQHERLVLKSRVHSSTA